MLKLFIQQNGEIDVKNMSDDSSSRNNRSDTAVSALYQRFVKVGFVIYTVQIL
jgi:hypothetical protein